ncbi:hypothetical protein [Ruminococcus sp.]|uniref:hypothetical protein n=1 Tax=Ruminococcus sp. TaxID=41978 RepID=UPI002E81DF83|nr:hypothetical protein [Ruminococcus sp.]MEE3492257.1 hypothetical protein [Ruminococcus sp.]
MSKNRKNFHYHYAEKFEKTSRECKRHLFVSPIALVISLVLLVVFGLVSATFSVYVTDNLNDPDSVSDGSMLIKVRDHKKRIDAGLDAPLHRSDLPVVQTGADADVAPLSVGDKGDLLILNTGSWGGTSPAFDAYVSDGTNNAWLQFSPFYDNYFYTTLPTSFKATSMVLYRSSAHISSDSGYWNKTDSIDISTTSNSYWMDGYSYGHWADNMSFNLYSNHSSMNGKSLSYDGAGHLTAFGEKVLANSTSVEYKVSSSYGKWFGGDNNKTDTSYSTNYYYDITVSFDMSKATVTNHSDLTITKTRYNKVSRSATPNNGSLLIGTQSNPTTTSADVLPEGTYYVKAIPNTNYQIKTLTVGGQQVTLTDAQKSEGVNQSFTMGSSDVAVSVVYEERLIPHWAENAFDNITKSVTDTTTFYASGTIMYPSSASDTLTVEASVTSGNSVETNGNPTISGSGGTTGTAIIPLRITNKTGNSTITAVLKDGNTTMGSTTFTVTVSEPTVLFDNLSIEECRSGTLTVSSSNPALQNGWTYSWSTTSSDITLDSGASITSQPITAKPYNAASHEVKLTVTYPSGYQKTYTKTITVTQSEVTFGIEDGNTVIVNNEKITYDKTASTTYGKDFYTRSVVLEKPNHTYNFYFKVNGTTYKNGGKITSTRDSCKVESSTDTGWVFNTTGNNCRIETGNAGTYTFYIVKATKTVFISPYPQVEFYVRGLGENNNNQWALTPERRMTAEGNNLYSWYIDLTYDQAFEQGKKSGFKIYKNDGTFYGLQSTFTNTDTVTLTSNDPGESYNLGLTGTYSGRYTFTFNSSTLALTVTYPSRTVKSQAYFNGSAEGTEASIGSSSDFVTITYIGQDKFRLTANTASDFAYTFEKWRNDNTNTNPREITVTNSNPVQIDSDWTYSSFDIYLHTVISGVTATGFTQDSVDNTKLIGSYTYPNSVTLPTPTGPSGYTFAGWYDNSSCTGNALTAPEIAAGSTDVKEFWAKWTIAITINDNIDGNTLYTYNIPYNGSINPSKNDWNSADVALVNRGYTLSGFNDNSWTNLTTSKTIIAIYVPNVYDFDVTFTPNQYVEDKNGNAGSSMAQGTGDSAASPYVLTFGSDIAVSASFTAPANLDSNITYNWFIMNGSSRVPVPSTKTSSAGAVTVTYENDHVSSMMTQMAQNGNGVEFTLYVEATVTTASGTFTNSLNKSDTIYYKVKSPIDALSVVPDQLIYSSAPDLSVIITTHSSITNDNVTKLMSSFKSVLQYYDKDTDQFTDLVGNVAITGQKPVFSSTVAANTYREEDASAASGVNYFKFKLQELISGQPARDDSETSERTITVGAFDAQTSRPLFVKSDVDLTDYRVMLFYVNSNNQLNYQTSEYSSTNSWYRFEIPSNDSGNTPISVCIAAFDKDEKYVLPKYNNGTYTWSDGTTGFDTHVFGHGHVDVSSDTQYVTIKSLSGTTFTIE